MNAKLPLMALSFGIVAGSALAQNNQAPQTDYQRIMNSVNNSSSAAYSQPQADDDAANSTGASSNATTGTPPVAANGQNEPNSANLPTDGIANTYSANGAPGGFGANNRVGYGNMTGGVGAGSTTSGSVGIGAYNASPYNSMPNSNGRGGGGFTGQ